MPVTERIPHKDVSYAFLEISADTANEFEALREETLKRTPHYAFALAIPAEPKQSEATVVAATSSPPASEAEAGEVPIDGESDDGGVPASAPTSTEGLSPREIARQRMAQKGA